MHTVTIRGQSGSRPAEIGRLVADRLQIDYVDREIIAEVASRLHRQKQDIAAKEMPSTSLLDRIAEALERSHAPGFGEVYLPTWETPLNDPQYLKALESAIKELAEGHSIVIRGRGSQFILRDYPQALHVLVVAPLEVRLKRVMERQNLAEKAAKREISRVDGSRREFTRRYFHAKLEDPVNYDLVINTGSLSVEDAASIIVDALLLKERTISGQVTI
ncbi:MAG: cytidylate kinase-like family protein [Dehalococcoidia bacterium]|nr:cytidylate kinase-like family protein [Dehalococcoidia bacterium]